MRSRTLYYTALACAAIGLSCNGTGEKPHSDSTAAVQQVVKDSVENPNGDQSNDYEIMYIVVADTGSDYYALSSKMHTLSNTRHWPIDTMDRYYNKQKDKIVLSDTNEDEMYRGEYFPRRFTSENLSLEYYTEYSDKTADKNIALVAGIYEAQQQADSFLAVLKRLSPRSFVQKANVFVGCMH
jgi:hypothetical protein